MALSATCLSSTHRVEQNLLKKRKPVAGKNSLIKQYAVYPAFRDAPTCAKKNGRIQFLKVKKQFKVMISLL